MISGHGGNIYEAASKLGCLPDDIIDMSSNVNPVGPPPGLLTYLKEHIHEITALPEVDSRRAVRAFAERYRIDPRQVASGSGTTQFIYSLPQALQTEKALILGPTYADYADACILHGISPDYITAKESDGFQPDLNETDRRVSDYDTVFICNPNNPTGALIRAAELEALCRSHPDTRFVVDESYLSFVGSGEKESLLPGGLPNLIVLISFSKVFRIPGLRIGFAVSSKTMMERILRYALPWSLNGPAQAAVLYLMSKSDRIDDFIKQTTAFVETEKTKLVKNLETASGITVFPSTTLFMLGKLKDGRRTDTLCRRLEQSRILIRNCADFQGLSDCFIRFSLKTSALNDLFVHKILEL